METFELTNFRELPFGENITQNAVISEVPDGLDYEIIKESNTLEYIDYIDMTKVVEILSEFFDVNASAISKQGLLRSVALGSSVDNAFEKIMDSDSVCLQNSTIGFSKKITLSVAKQISKMNFRNVIATDFEKEALDYLQNESDVNAVKIKSPLQELLGITSKEIRYTPFGYLIQDKNISKLTKSSFKVAGKIKPVQQQAEDAIFAWKISKYTTSKSAVIARNLVTCGIAQGYCNLTDAVENVMDIACEKSKDAVLSVDGVIESEEVINASIQGRIGLIIEAGDSALSPKFAKLCDKYNISLIKTGIRNNRY